MSNSGGIRGGICWPSAQVNRSTRLHNMQRACDGNNERRSSVASRQYPRIVHVMAIDELQPAGVPAPVLLAITQIRPRREHRLQRCLAPVATASATGRCASIGATLQTCIPSQRGVHVMAER
jgi:hypothetical protein